MKYDNLRKAFLSILSVALSALASCSPGQNADYDPSKKTVSTTFGPMYDFAKRIVGDRMNVISIVGENEPHGFSPNDPLIAGRTEGAELLIAYGQGMDDYARNMNPEKYFEATSGISFMKASQDGGSDPEAIDPHAWLSLRDAQKMLENIAFKIIEIDSENRSYYEENLASAKEQFNSLDQEFTAKLSASEIKTRAIVTSHEAIGYLARDYGLTQYGIADVADNEINAARISQVVDYAFANEVHTIFVEELDNVGNVEAVIDEIHRRDASYRVDTATFNAYEGVDVTRWAQEDNYLSVMRGNLEEISSALTRADQ